MSFVRNHPGPRVTAGEEAVVATFLIGPRKRLPHPAARQPVKTTGQLKLAFEAFIAMRLCDRVDVGSTNRELPPWLNAGLQGGGPIIRPACPDA
jgi:hypothetical protein